MADAASIIETAVKVSRNCSSLRDAHNVHAAKVTRYLSERSGVAVSEHGAGFVALGRVFGSRRLVNLELAGLIADMDL